MAPETAARVRTAVAGLSLSVVMPARNEASYLSATLAALMAAADRSEFVVDLVFVDDGSTDGSADVARAAVSSAMPLHVLSPSGVGRFDARTAGLSAAQSDLVLLLDARVRLRPDALRFVHEQVSRGETVWNGHVEVEATNDLGLFWRLLAELAWRDYFDDPRTARFGSDDFDRFPKGTTCFLAPRPLLLWAFEQFRTRYANVHLANDDTPALRALAARQPIAISPGFACTYIPRASIRAFLRHSFRRGAVFLDGHGRPESRFFPVTLAFYPVSASLVVASARRPWVAVVAAASCGLAAAAYGASAGRSLREIRALALVTPLYAVGHGLGMWRGLGELVRSRAAR